MTKTKLSKKDILNGLSKKHSPNCPNCNLNHEIKLLHSSVNNFDIYFCLICNNSFTNPVPADLSKYYHSNYWISHGLLGNIKEIIFNIFQNRRKLWIQKYLKKGNILEIGPGEGKFQKMLGDSYDYLGIEFPKALIKNKKILKINFLKWRTNEKYDAIIFWESLEHVATPQQYLKKSNQLLSKDGLVLIEIPRFNCYESNLFKHNWFHLDPPRHLVHLSNNGLKNILSRTDFKILEMKSVLAPEYTIWGLTASILNKFGIQPTDYFKKSKFPLLFVLLIPLLVISSITELTYFLLKQSPINFIAAKKING